MATPSPELIAPIIVGTAGHIDHGKSSLVKRLTGIDPDRLQEEKDRGMTIDLGFARFHTSDQRLVGIIDVPGHERFIKNMVAGATSVDVVMLVVAADDGVMPQTREHLEILTLLGIEKGLVVVTKKDLVDADLLELAIEDVRELLAGTFLEGAPVLPCSNTSGEGIDEVRALLEEFIAAVAPRPEDGLFRMPIQRVFSAKGHGTVVTGVPLSGRLVPGSEVEIQPLGKRGKVRGLHAYGQSCTQIRAGHSSALNLSDLDYREICRGMVAASPGFFEAASLWEARLQYLSGRGGPIKHRTPVRFHVGTSEVMGLVRLIEVSELAPGESALVQIELEEPVVAAQGDRFLVRQPSPMLTLGGGVLLGPTSHHRRRLKDYHISALRQREDALQSPAEAARFAAEQHRFRPFTDKDLAVDLALTHEKVGGLVKSLLEEGDLVELGRGQLLSREFSERARKQLLATLKELHKKHPLKKLLELRQVRSHLDLPEAVLKSAVERAVAKGQVSEEGEPGHLRLSAHQPAITDADRQLLVELRAEYATAELKPPSPAQAADRLEADAVHVEHLLGLLGDEGEMLRVGPLFFHHMAIERAKQELVKNAQAHGGQVDIPALRDELATSRKYMIPLLEYFDGIRLTVRRGDQRFLRGGG